MRVLENVSLKRLNSFGIDVSAQYFIEATTREDIIEFIEDSKFRNMHRLILGGGSNILLRKDISGVVLKAGLRGIELLKEDADHYYVRAGAGESWHGLVMDCVKNNYAGIENLSLIPGNVGAAPMQNIGAYGVELKDVFENLEAIDLNTGERRTFGLDACKFGYRNSVFKNIMKERYVITSVTIRLFKEPHLNTSYGAIEQELEAMGVEQLNIAAVSRAVMNIRTARLPDPARIGNAGSFFKNPIVSQDEFLRVRSQFPDVVSFPSEEGVKLAAGWLIDQCGWKGKRIGDAGVHKRHALVLVNYGEAGGDDIYDLSQKILDSVDEKFGITLEREVNVI